MRQVAYETYRVHHLCLLAIWHSKLTLHGGECLKQSIVAFKVGITAEVYERRFACIGIPDDSNQWRCIMFRYLFRLQMIYSFVGTLKFLAQL